MTDTHLSHPPVHPNNPDRLSVLPDWISSLAIQQQSVLILGTRGPDGVGKFHPAKGVHRAYRASVLTAAMRKRELRFGEGADNFMALDEFASHTLWTNAVRDYFAYVDSLPHHYHMHLMHGAEILGYKHPDSRFRVRWMQFYVRCCKDLHLTPETEYEMDERLNDVFD